MNIAIVTFDGFNEIDSFVSSHILNRVRAKGWNVAITCPSESVRSQNGVCIAAHRPLEFANDAESSCLAAVRSRERLLKTGQSCLGCDWTRSVS